MYKHDRWLRHQLLLRFLIVEATSVLEDARRVIASLRDLVAGTRAGRARPGCCARGPPGLLGTVREGAEMVGSGSARWRPRRSRSRRRAASAALISARSRATRPTKAAGAAWGALSSAEMRATLKAFRSARRSPSSERAILGAVYRFITPRRTSLHRASDRRHPSARHRFVPREAPDRRVLASS